MPPRNKLDRNRKACRRRDPNKRFLVYFEGSETERIYINGIRKLLRETRAPIVIDPGNRHGNPLEIVRGAKKRKEESCQTDPYDAVWCIFDVEAPEPHPSLDPALKLARDADIQCAVSNPCFELWLILHLKEHNRHDTTKKICQLAEQEIDSYSSKVFDFDDLAGGISKAVDRAKILDGNYPPHAHCKQKNPWTSMWELIQFLQDNGWHV